MNNKSKGFTLVELIATIFIISLLLSIGVVSVIGIINRSNEKSTILAENNIKRSANLFVKEYKDNIVWELDENNNMYSCVSVKSLAETGYLKKDNVLTYEDKYIKVVKDEDNNIISEEIDSEVCQVNNNQIKIPTSQTLCNNLAYTGLEQSLINQDKLEQKDNEYVYDLYINNELKLHSDIKVIDSGTYKVDLKLKDNYIWNDGSKEKKTIDCTINKAIPTLELSSLGTESSSLGTTITKLKSSIPGKIQLKSSDLNYVVPSLTDDNNLVEAGEVKDININVLATRDTNTYVTITLIPSDEYKNNYYTNSIVYTVGNIEKEKLQKPDSTFCKNIYYNNTSQELVEPKEGYKYYNYIGQDIGKYTVKVVPKYGYMWEDGTEDTITFSCEIKRPTIKVNYVGASCTPSYKKILFEDLYGELCVSTKTGYTLEGWYYTNSYKTKVTSEDKVTNLQEHNIHAKWTEKTYTVKFNSNGGTGTMSSKTATYNQSFTVPSNSFTKTGYTFAGWTTNNDGTDDGYNWTGWSGKWIYDNGDYGISNDTLTLYARWTINKVTIKYRANGGTIATPTKTSDGKTTYTWTTDSNSNIKRATNGETSKILTSSINHNASLSGNGLVNYNNANSLNITKSGYKGANNEWKCLSGCTTSGKTFDQETAYVASEFCDTSTKSCTVVLGVNWTPKTYTVKFNSNGGTGTMSSKTATYNQSFSVPSNTFKKTGYTFAGWTTKRDGTDDGYNWTGWSGTWKYDNGSYGISNDTLTLYARWTINTVTIKYRPNGGTITKTTKTSDGKTTYTWTTDSSGNIKRATNGGTSTVLTSSINHNASLNTNGLANYNNANYLKITRSGYVGAANEWKCLSGCTKSGKTFDQGTAYAASEFCDTSTKSCTVVLGVNWIADKPDDKTVKLYAYNWSGTSSDCIDTKNKCDRKSVNISGYTKFKVKLKKYLAGETPPSNTSWGEVELRQGTGGSEGKGTKVIEGGKYYSDKNYESGWLNVKDYFSSSSVTLTCLAVGYTGESSCEITFTAS